MLMHLVQALLAGWVLYSLWRVVAAPRHAVQVGTELGAACPAEAAFQVYMRVREFYLALSPAHLKYEMRGEHLGPDTVIDVWEQAGFQRVQHQYRVAALVPGRRMDLVSEQSQVRVLGLFRSTSRSEVSFRFDPDGQAACRLGLSICIVFPNAWRHLLARLFFTQAIWQRHAEQEMRALARVIEQRYQTAPATAA